MASGLLQAIQAVGGDELLDEVLTAHRLRVGERFVKILDERVPDEAPLLERVRALSVIQDEQGYLSDVQLAPDGTIRLHERNCAVYQVASGEPAVCAAELALFRDVLGREVVLETHIVSGDRCCTFRIDAAD